MDQDGLILQVSRLEAFVRRCLLRLGVEPDIAEVTAGGIIFASVRGIDSHGIRLLPHYTAAIGGGRINTKPELRFTRTAPSTGTLDADHTFGHAAGYSAMTHAIELAREAGIGLVSVRNATHCGAVSYFVLPAARKGMIGYGTVHASATVKTPNSAEIFLGTNPVCWTFPVDGEDPVCFDCAPTAFTKNKIRLFADLKIPLPSGVAADAVGAPTTDATLAAQLLPIGDYKGFGHAFVADVLCALLSGMPAGRSVSQMFNSPMTSKRKLGQMVGAIRIDCFEEVAVFRRRLKEMIEEIRALPRTSPETPVMVPGDPEKRTEAERLRSGIPLSAREVESLVTLSKQLEIDPP